jgi:Na+/H+ antiporter NhaD/arsenite permease-like protein
MLTFAPSYILPIPYNRNLISITKALEDISGHPLVLSDPGQQVIWTINKLFFYTTADMAYARSIQPF